MRAAKLYFLLVLLGASPGCFSQYMDTLRMAFAGRKTVDIGFDSRNSFVDNERVGVQTLKLGIVFGKKIAMGIGYAWLNRRTPLYDSYHFYDKDLNRDTFVTSRLAFNYLRFYVNYIYYRSRRWEFSIPLQIGVGKLAYKYSYRDIAVKSDLGYCFLYEPEIDVKFRLFRWLGIEGDVGYRFLFKNNKFVKNTFNSPILAIGVFIVWNELALMAFPKNESIQKKLGPGDW